jgi:hypothetical protein
MSWQGFLSDDRQEQEQLDILRPLIEDATKDSVLWLQSDSSAEERAHVLALQTGLTDLARIVERRMERRKLPKDEWEYSETVTEVLTRLEKAREAGGGKIVGKGLARLAEHLPKELPGSKPPKRPRVKIPPPVKPLNTSGGIWLGPPAAQMHHEQEVAMEYPGNFPTESRARVEAARIRAGRRFDSDKAKAKWNSDIEALFKTYVLTMFLAFAQEASRLRLWPVDKMRENCQEFLRLLTIEAYFQKGKAAGLRDMISNWNGTIIWEFQQEIEKTPQWRKFENILLKLAEGSTGEKQAESSRAQNRDKIPQSIKSKSAHVAVGNTREEILRPILDKQGLTVHGWANQASVDFHTADNYLKGVTKPYPDTLKKLADVLGVKVEELPE